MTIDAWIQHPTPQMLHHPMFDTLRRWVGAGSIPDVVPVELTLGMLDAAGVERAALTAWIGPQGTLVSNDQVAALCRAHPSRFFGLASLDLYDPMGAVRELRRRVEEDGFRGVRILPWLWRLPPNDRRYYPIYAACIDLGVPFCLQVGHAGPLLPSEPGRPIPYLDEVACEFPELTIVAGHIGAPWVDEMISLARKYPGVHIDTSAYKPSRFPTQLVDYLRGRGRTKVLFGSNFPMLTPGACLAEVDILGLDAEASDLFLRTNAIRVFGLT
ncbi:MAG: amidohydrolase [Myxococcales bacterium]|nr:amidohydrolase [Myxococcales bacterium]MCB9530213.1 amidohydrolase [Myxococcales bacterium]MCB9533726.1 amidohydrolase [Myxococcales bacterium]